MPDKSSILDPLVRKLQLWLALDAADRAAILALPHSLRADRANDFLVREGDEPVYSGLLLSGFACRHKSAGNGARQIFSIHMKGDMVDLHNSVLGKADHNVQALTAVEMALIPVQAIRQLMIERPQVGQALWYETLGDAAIFREWTLNAGRRDGRARTAHLLCEIGARLEVAGLGSRMKYEIPMTQEQLADALALTSIHVNRTLRALESEGLIERKKRTVSVTNFKDLARVGDFDEGYLHLDGNGQR